MKRALSLVTMIPPVAIVLIAAALAVVAQLQMATDDQALALGLVFLICGAAGAWAMTRRPIAPAAPLPRWLEVSAFAGILGVAAYLRLTQLAILPEGVWFDEASLGIFAQRILDNPAFRPVHFDGEYHLHGPALYSYLQAGMIALIGPTILALRLVTSLVGLAMVAGVYGLARVTFGAPVAIAVGLLMASQRWNLTLSRTAMNPIFAPAVALGVFFFLFRALRGGRRRDYVIAGLLLGLGIHTYSPFYITWPLVGVVVLLWAWQSGSVMAFLRARWRDLGLMLASALIVMLPMIGYIATHTKEYTDRSRQTSVFRDNKPWDQVRADLISNVRQHALMFHISGDRNGRHNLPGEPMLDPITGGLLALGVAYAIARLRRPENALLVGWLGLGLLPGILSLEFEAPQALRGVMAMAPVALLAALPVGWLLTQAWAARRRWPAALVAAPAVATLLLIVAANYQTFFHRQLTDHAAWSSYSLPETLMARSIAALPADTRVLISEGTHSMPTLEFMLPERRTFERFDPAQHLPIRGDQPVALYLLPEQDRRMVDITTAYPGATVTEHRGPNGGESVMTAIRIDRDQIAAVRGVTAHYHPGIVTDPGAQPPVVQRTEPALAATWEDGAPLPPPFTARWRSTLALPQYGKYRFRVEGPPETMLAIDGAEVTRVGQDGVELTLAQGNHALTMQAAMTALTPVRVLWQPPGTRGWLPLAREHLFIEPVTATGLLGNYFSNTTWTGPPALQRIDSTVAFRFHTAPVPRPWTVEWTGQLAISTPGIYRFAVRALDPVQFSIDDRLLIDSARPNETVERPITLTAGLHPIKVRYQDASSFSHVAVYWQPPGGEREFLPTERLIPTTVADPKLVTLPPAVPAVPAAAAAGPRPVQTEVTTLVAAADLDGAEKASPRGVALDPAGNIYVVDTVNRLVRKFDPNGAPLWTVGPGQGDAALVEPVAVAIAGNGEVIVLDSKPGYLHRFDAAGTLLGRIAGAEGRFYQPRGLDVDPNGDVYVADTGNGRIPVVNPQGGVTAQLGVKGGEAGQIREPTDVVVDRFGSVFVADSANSKLVAYAADSSLRAEWPLPTSSSVIGPHLTSDGRGGVYVTDPDHGMIRQYGPSGELLAEFGPLLADDTEVRRPMGIELAAPDVLIVSDLESRRIVKVTLKR